MKDLLQNKELLLRYLLYGCGILVAVGVINALCFYAGRKVRLFNTLGGILHSLVGPLVLICAFLAVLTGGAWLGFPWYVAGPAALLLFIFGVGFIWTRR